MALQVSSRHSSASWLLESSLTSVIAFELSSHQPHQHDPADFESSVTPVSRLSRPPPPHKTMTAPQNLLYELRQVILGYCPIYYVKVTF